MRRSGYYVNVNPILLANWPQGRKSAYFCYWPGPIFRADTSAYEFANSIESWISQYSVQQGFDSRRMLGWLLTW